LSGAGSVCQHANLSALQQVVVTRDGHHRHGRQRFACAHRGRNFTLPSASAFSGYRWPADVILMRYAGTCAPPVRHECDGAAGRARYRRVQPHRAVALGPNVRAPTGRRSSQAPSPARRSLVRRRNVLFAAGISGTCTAPSTSTVRWWTCCCGTTATPHPLKRSSSRRSATQAKRRARSSPTTISRTSRRSAGACQPPCTFGAGCIARLGETTKPIERSHVPTRDRLRASRGLKTLRTGQRFLEGFECLRAAGTSAWQTCYRRPQPRPAPEQKPSGTSAVDPPQRATASLGYGSDTSATFPLAHSQHHTTISSRRSCSGIVRGSARDSAPPRVSRPSQGLRVECLRGLRYLPPPGCLLTPGLPMPPILPRQARHGHSPRSVEGAALASQGCGIPYLWARPGAVWSAAAAVGASNTSRCALASRSARSKGFWSWSSAHSRRSPRTASA
jgi:hypothetical protein